MPADVVAPFFKSKGWRPFEFQRETWEAYWEGKSGLLHAATGLGKTLAVYLGPLVESLPDPGGCQILWLTPLRALATDTLRALREPVAVLAPHLEVEARTGDTPSALRARLRKRLPHTLVTTPESLSLMLTHDDFREKLSGLRCVITDEWHELLGSKRGVQTELCLARLRAWFPGLRVWGLSATLGNLTEARQTLLGNAFDWSVEITADLSKPISIETIIPKEIERFPWAGHIGTQLAPAVMQHVEKAATTLLFTNTRSQTEIWFQELLALRPDWKDKLAMHHGSLDREERAIAENGLRDGSLKCVVCTSSLDLGVDFSPVDQVIQVGSPKGIARLLQRAGRYTVDDKRLILQHRLSIGTISSDPAIVLKFANGHTLGTVEESFIAGIKTGGHLIFAGRQLHICGHWHPIVKIADGKRTSLRLPCFLLRGNTLVLPAYGSFTGGAVLKYGSGDRIFVALRDEVIEVPEKLFC